MIIDKLVRRQNDATETAALPVNMLGCRIDDAIGTKLQRLLLHGRGKHIINRELSTMRMGYFGNRCDIDDLKRRVGRAFEKENFGIGTHSLFPCRQIGTID